MATIKSYTDLQQSKKLAEILPLESADMCYKCLGEDPYDIVMRPYTDWKEEYKGLLISGDANVFPCWSLAGLLNVIPKEIFKGKYVINITEGKYNKWIITYDSGYSDSFYGLIASDNNLVDACVYIIERAHKLNLL